MVAEITQLISGDRQEGAVNTDAGGRIGIVDIGSNTVRLVVFDAPARLPVPIFNERVTCRLGRGIGHTGKLNPEGVELAFKALARFTGIAREIPVERFKMVATAAVRDAADGAAFTNEVEARFNYPVDVLSGAEDCFLPLLEAGGAGCITACSNVSSQLAQDVYQAYKNGTDASAANDPLCAIRGVIQNYPLSSALKQLIARHSGNDAWKNTRPPFVDMDDVTRQKLFNEFDAIGHSLPVAA